MLHVTEPLPANLNPLDCNDEPDLLHALRCKYYLSDFKFSFKSDDGVQSYAQKTDLRVTESFASNGPPHNPPTDFTLRGKLDKSKHSSSTSHVND